VKAGTKGDGRRLVGLRFRFVGNETTVGRLQNGFQLQNGGRSCSNIPLFFVYWLKRVGYWGKVLGPLATSCLQGGIVFPQVGSSESSVLIWAIVEVLSVPLEGLVSLEKELINPLISGSR
jgi:hypothetical protein